MKTYNISKAITAGLIATFAMTVVMLMGPMMGMPEMNIGKMLGGFMGVPTAIGWTAHFMIGSALAVGYAVVFAGRLSISPWLRGMMYGLIPWLMSQILVNPMMGAGVFASNTPAPVLMAMGSLIGHLAYGLFLGIVYGFAGHARAVPSHS